MVQTLTPVEPTNLKELQGIAKFYAESGMFPHLNTTAKAFVVIQAGRAWGFGAFASVSGINVIHGRPEMSAGMMSARLKQYMNGKYNYSIERLDNQACELVFTEHGEALYRSTFTVDDAQRAQIAGGHMWNKYRRNMLFARALSNGARWACPDAFGGPVYVAGEISNEGNGLSADGSETLDEIIGNGDIEDNAPMPDPRDIARDTFPFHDNVKGQPWQQTLRVEGEVSDMILQTLLEEAAAIDDRYGRAQVEEALGASLEAFDGSTADLWLAFCIQVAEDRARAAVEPAA